MSDHIKSAAAMKTASNLHTAVTAANQFQRLRCTLIHMRVNTGLGGESERCRGFDSRKFSARTSSVIQEDNSVGWLCKVFHCVLAASFGGPTAPSILPRPKALCQKQRAQSCQPGGCSAIYFPKSKHEGRHEQEQRSLMLDIVERGTGDRRAERNN